MEMEAPFDGLLSTHVRKFWIPATGFRIPIGNGIPDSKFQHSGFHGKNLPDSRFHKEKFCENFTKKCKPTLNSREECSEFADLLF